MRDAKLVKQMLLPDHFTKDLAEAVGRAGVIRDNVTQQWDSVKDYCDQSVELRPHWSGLTAAMEQALEHGDDNEKQTMLDRFDKSARALIEKKGFFNPEWRPDKRSDGKYHAIGGGFSMTEDSIRAVRKMRDEKAMNYVELAEEFGVSVQAIENIIEGCHFLKV